MLIQSLNVISFRVSSAVEQLTVNQLVASSNLALGVFLKLGLRMNDEIFIDLINEITDIQNHMVKGNIFQAGFLLCFHQQHLVELRRKHNIDEST